jgi:hypothetical protein
MPRQGVPGTQTSRKHLSNAAAINKLKGIFKLSNHTNERNTTIVLVFNSDGIGKRFNGCYQ